MKQKYYLTVFEPTHDDIGKPVYLASGGQSVALAGLEPIGVIRSIWRDEQGVYAVKVGDESR